MIAGAGDTAVLDREAGPGLEPEDGGCISVYGARTHNLKNVSVRIPRDKLVVITGVSGSGKSSLAFDTLYAEGQRRYIESLSSYARQFLEQMPRPDCDRILGLPPTIAIQQHVAVGGPRSTVATTTEIYDFFRLLYARAGTPHCPDCGTEILHQTLEQIAVAVAELPVGTRVTLLAPLVRGRKGHYRELFDRIRSEGYVKARVDGEIRDLDEVDRLHRYKTHDIDVVVDRLVIKKANSHRIVDSVRTALSAGAGMCVVLRESGEETVFSQHFACTRCGVGFEEPTPKMFSFNSPYGACPRCSGLGTVDEFDEELIVPDLDTSLQQGAVQAWQGWGGRAGRHFRQKLTALTVALRIDWARPFRTIGREARRALMSGEGLDGLNGLSKEDAVIPSLRHLQETSTSEHTQSRLRRYLSPVVCPGCDGARLRAVALAAEVGGKNIYEVSRMTVSDCLVFFNSLSFEGARQKIASPIVKEIRNRLSFMIAVGLHYLTGDRLTHTLSSGESQRIRLATQIGSSLTGVCYVLDEPSIGLHYRDNQRLLDSLERLREAGNTVLVVEHDEPTIRRADWVLDLGPGAGRRGGSVVFNGPVSAIQEERASVTGQYLSGQKQIPVPGRRRKATRSRALRVIGARQHNLKNIDVTFPLGLFCCVTGVSGSGKSTLVIDILYRALARKLYGSSPKPGAHDAVLGADQIDRVLQIDQSPIGKTPRSTPATYTKVFDQIREVFAQTRQAQVRGYDHGRFSYNTKGGRCEACQGRGAKKIEMNFLPDVSVTCEECGGQRYNQESLQVTVRGRNIADVLAMTVAEALEFFKNYPGISRTLHAMQDVGLDYLTLGQPSPTLSGGEAQRIKLTRELGKVATGHTLYILDEPTTGLHFEDIGKLLPTLHSLTDMGNTVIVIEHNLEVIKNADYIVDLGPEGGAQGGRVVAQRTPEAVARNEDSYTGQALRHVLVGWGK